jgi:hypothetical protein
MRIFHKIKITLKYFLDNSPVKKLNDISQKIDSLQKAHAQTRAQMEQLRTELISQSNRAEIGGRQRV